MTELTVREGSASSLKDTTVGDLVVTGSITIGDLTISSSGIISTGTYKFELTDSDGFIVYKGTTPLLKVTDSGIEMSTLVTLTGSGLKKGEYTIIDNNAYVWRAVAN